jgi:hypothetical protein
MDVTPHWVDTLHMSLVTHIIVYCCVHITRCLPHLAMTLPMGLLTSCSSGKCEHPLISVFLQTKTTDVLMADISIGGNVTYRFRNSIVIVTFPTVGRYTDACGRYKASTPPARSVCLPFLLHPSRSSCPPRHSGRCSHPSAMQFSLCTLSGEPPRQQHQKAQDILAMRASRGARYVEGGTCVRCSHPPLPGAWCTPARTVRGNELEWIQVQTWMSLISMEKTRAPSFARSAARGRPTTSELLT